MTTKLGYVVVACVAIALGFVAARYWLKPMNEAPTSVSTALSKAPPTHSPVLTLPDFSLKNRQGTLQSIRSWPGKSLVVNFWATWCAPCRREIPLLQKIQTEHAAEGVQVVGIAVDFRDDVLKYADEFHLDYPLLIGEQDGLAAIDAFGIEAVGFPFTIFTDNQGDIVATHLGELQSDEVGLILNIVQKINHGEVPVEKGRTQVAAALASRKPKTSS